MHASSTQEVKPLDRFTVAVIWATALVELWLSWRRWRLEQEIHELDVELRKRRTEAAIDRRLDS